MCRRLAIPFLNPPDDPGRPLEGLKLQRALTAADVMSDRLATLPVVVRCVLVVGMGGQGF